MNVVTTPYVDQASFKHSVILLPLSYQCRDDRQPSQHPAPSLSKYIATFLLEKQRRKQKMNNLIPQN